MTLRRWSTLFLAIAGTLTAVLAGPAQAASQEVVLQRGDDFQQVVDVHPPGTTYRIAAGVHRLQSISPKSGDRFIGDPGAVMSGARVLSGWKAARGFWYVDGQTQQGRIQGRIAPDGNQRDAFPEELWVDGKRWRHVGSFDQLGPGRWYFDYGADRIWIGRDPALLGLVETSVKPHAIASGSRRPTSGVVVSRLVVERYASPTQKGALGSHAAHDWTLRRVTARYNHGAGIRLGPGSLLDAGKVHGNGQIGVVGNGVDVPSGYSGPLTMRRTEVTHNSVLDFRLTIVNKDSHLSAAGARFTMAPKGLTVENNWIHDNAAHGLWMDNGVYFATVRSNRVEDNAYRGIFYEISYGPHPVHGGIDSRIYWNQVWRNGAMARLADERKGGGVTVSNSRDVRVYGNALDRNHGGVLLIEAAGRTPHTKRVRVVGNDIRYSTGWTGLYTRNLSDSEADAYHRSEGNRFSRNTYRLGRRTEPRFYGVRRPVRGPGWKRLGHDLNSRFLGTRDRPRLPRAADAFRRLGSYGA